MRRPGLYLAIAFATGIFLSKSLGIRSILSAAILAILSAFTGVVIPRGYRATVSTLAAALFAGIFAFSYCELTLSRSELRLIFGDKTVRLRVRGDLLQSPSWSHYPQKEGRFPYRAGAFMNLTEAELPKDWFPVSGKVRVRFLADQPVGLACGDFVELNGTLRRIRRATNPGQFDSRSFWHIRGIEYSLLVKGDSQVKLLEPKRVGRLRRWIEAVRARLRRGLELGVPDCPASRVIIAMILGYRENITEDITKSFRSTNTLHILAISGLHVGFVYLIINALLKAMLLPHRVQAMIAIPVIACYAILTGARTPVVRASIMFISFLMAPLFGRQRDILNSLGIAALIILIVNPLQLFNAGFQLSFVAVLSILILANPIKELFLSIWPCAPLPGQLLVSRWERFRWSFESKLILLVSASIAAWLGLTPIIARTFHVFTPLGIVGNVVVIPAGLAIICLGFLAITASFILSGLAIVINWLNWLVVSLMLWFINILASIPGACFNIATLTPLQIASYYGLVAIGYLAFLNRGFRTVRPILLVTAAILFVMPFAFLPQEPVLKIFFLDVWEGDATYMELPDGKNLLIDGGPEMGFPAGRMVLKPFLQSRGRSKLNTVLLTHPHLDHMSGLFTILEGFSVGKVVLARCGDSSNTYKEFLEMVRQKKIPICSVARGDCLVQGEGLETTVLNPGPNLHNGTRSDINNNSVALLLTYGKTRIIICADMEREAEEELCQSGLPLKADILRVGHHGSATSSTTNFLERVSPEWAIISAGTNNRFGHPAPEAIVRLREKGIKLLRTDVHGAVIVSTNGKEIDIETFR